MKIARNCPDMHDQISIVHGHDVNRDKWDACVQGANNALVYGASWWMDHMADNWTGIIMNDYDAVMPVPWRKKWGVKYHYDLPFTQQLGIFFHNELTQIRPFSEGILEICRYGNYPFNYANHIGGVVQTNYIMPLENGYEKGFANDVIQNIRRSAQMELQYLQAEFEEAIDVFRVEYKQRIRVTEDEYKKFEKLCVFIGKNGKLIVRKVTTQNGKLLAIALMPFYKERMYNLMNTTLAEGKKCEANYFLLNEIWKEFAGSNVIFDFEGSDIPGVKAFYRKFGAVNQPYVKMHFNRLPWPVKMVKK